MQQSEGKKHKIFKGIASFSKSSTGWFYSLKMFLVINAMGEIMSCIITPAAIADNNFSMMQKLFRNLKGYIFADKGFIAQKAFECIYLAGLKLVTTSRKNLKNNLVPVFEKLCRRKRGIIESLNDILMTITNIDHTRHRSAINCVAQAYKGVSAYSYLDKLPSNFSQKIVSDP